MRTVIIIAHRLLAIRDCDRIITLHDGRLVEDGKHQDLITRDGIYGKLWRMQAMNNADMPVGATVHILPPPLNPT